MGFQHLTPEQRSEISSKGGRALWGNISEEDKGRLLKNSFHSDEAKEKSLEGRSEALKESWDRLSLVERQARIEAAAEGVRGVSQQKSESMERYWAGKSYEERHQHYLNSFGSEEAGRIRAVAMQGVWDGYTEEEKMARINRTINSEEARRHWKETYDALSEDEKREWIKVHLRGGSRKQTEPERLLEAYLDENYPGEWLYNGASRDITIGGKGPDFININGRKEILEVFGTYWHLLDEPEKLIEHYKKFGFRCTVFWDYECYLWKDIDEKLGVGGQA